VCRENENLGLEVDCLRDELYEVGVNFRLREDTLRRTEEERETHHAVAEQKAKEVEQLSVAL
jgi:hypothetical protein